MSGPTRQVSKIGSSLHTYTLMTLATVLYHAGIFGKTFFSVKIKLKPNQLLMQCMHLPFFLSSLFIKRSTRSTKPPPWGKLQNPVHRIWLANQDQHAHPITNNVALEIVVCIFFGIAGYSCIHRKHF